jgi:urease accessory protein
MKIYTEIIGNMWRSAEWKRRVEQTEQDHIRLDRWMAQKSRMLVAGESGRMYRISLRRGEHLTDGDIIDYSPHDGVSVVVSVEMTQVLAINMDQALASDHKALMRTAVELGHALGNQHWPAVVKDNMVYVPLVADRKVMQSVMETHHIEGVNYSFVNGMEVIPYLSPHEMRMLFSAHDEPKEDHKHRSDI